MSTRLPEACAACDEHLVSLAFDEPDTVPPECVAHAETCPRCAGELAALRDTRGLAALPLDEPSEELDARILAALDEHLEARSAENRTPTLMTILPGGASQQREMPPTRARRSWRASMAVAASLAVLGGGVLMISEGTRLARQGVPEASVLDQSVAPAQAKGAPPPPAPAPAERQENELASSDEALQPTAVAGEAEPPAAIPSDKSRSTRARSLPGEGTRPPPAKEEAAPVAKPKKVVEAKKTAPIEETHEAPAREQVASKMANIEADTGAGAALDDAAVERFAAAPAPSMPSSLGSLSTRSTAGGRGEAYDVDHDRLLSQADLAAARGDHRQAASVYARVARDDSAPRQAVLRALEGQARSLLALGRFDEASAAARRLVAMTPDASDLAEEIERARQRAAGSESK